MSVTFANDEQDVNAHEERKQAYRDKYKGMTLESLVVAMDEARKIKESLEEKLKLVNAAYDVLRIELIPAKMEEEGIEKITYAGIGRVTLTGDLMVRTIRSNQSKFYDWLRKNKLGDLIQETINASTLKVFCKNQIKAGQPVPEDFVKTTPFTRASITKA